MRLHNRARTASQLTKSSGKTGYGVNQRLNRRNCNVRYWHLADISLCAAHVCIWPKADIAGWSYAIPCRRYRTKVINLRATIVELLQQVESRTLLWFDGGGVSQRKGPNHA